MKLKDSTRRAVRTVYQGVIGAIVAVPILAAYLPTNLGRISTIAASIVGGTAVAAKVLNKLEDAGLIPAWLKAPASDGANPVPDPGTPDVGPTSPLAS